MSISQLLERWGEVVRMVLPCICKVLPVTCYVGITTYWTKVTTSYFGIMQNDKDIIILHY